MFVASMVSVVMVPTFVILSLSMFVIAPFVAVTSPLIVTLPLTVISPSTSCVPLKF